MKKEIISKLFSSSWNYAWGNVSNYLISLFYEKGGFSGLYDFIASKKQTMHNFNTYFSPDLLETLEKAKTLKDEDFREYIFNQYNKVVFNHHNFLKLEEYGLLKYYYDFSTSFRGDIKYLHKIGNYSFIETYRDNKINFYNEGDFSVVFDTLEHALLHKMFNGQYFDTLSTLLKSVNQE